VWTHSHVTVCFNFDTQKATNTEATGFIVDAQRGIILTVGQGLHFAGFFHPDGIT